MIRALLVALGFLTRVPVPAGVFDDTRATHQSLVWYSTVGGVIGVVLWLLAQLLHAWPPLLLAAVILIVWIGLTGALHLDGLADSADAWIGGIGSRERTLEIMKDPRCGPAGVVALVAVLLLKFAALASAPAGGGIALLLAPVLARAALTLAFVTTPYARAQGLGSALRDAPRGACWLGIAAAAVLALCFGVRGLVALIAAAVLFVLWRRACMRRLGGFTGDTCGALAELVEAVVLVAMVAAA
jgi:adenosylcobinamide-GDP ribazoletransferase